MAALVLSTIKKGTLMTNNPAITHTLNTASVTSTIAAILGMLPTVLSIIASLLSILWMCIQIYESKTIRRILNKGE